MSKVLLGSMDKYYAWRGAEPYLSFDGVRDTVDTPLLIYGDFSATIEFTPEEQDGLRYIMTTHTRSFDSGVYFHTSSDSYRLVVGTGDNLSGVILPNSLVFGKKTVAEISLVGDLLSLTVNGETATRTLNFTPVFNTQGVRFFGRSDTIVSVKGSLYSATINGTEYIKQGDQNPNNILPSHPKGADGTIHGAGWKYVGVDGHFETTTTINTWLDSFTLREPVVVQLLERMDTSTVPKSKDGWTITILQPPARGRSFDFSFNFNF